MHLIPLYHAKLGVTFVADRKDIPDGWTEDFPDGYRPKFPKIKYHAQKPPVCVAQVSQEMALGEGWFDFPQPEFKPKEVHGNYPKIKYQYIDAQKYRETHVLDEKEEDALGDDWYNTPTIALDAFNKLNSKKKTS